MKVGIVGCGQAANIHATVYRLLGDPKVVAVADINNDKAKSFAQKHGISKVFSDYTDMLEEKDIDFVDICTPTSTHAEIACAAAKSGYNILLEKPMAKTVQECDKIIGESKKSGIKLCIVHNQLFFPSVKQLRQMVEKGKYNVESIRVSYKVCQEINQSPSWVFTPEQKGILWELGYHPAYLQLAFLKEIQGIEAYGKKMKYPVYDKIGTLLSTRKANYGIIEISMISKQTEILLEMDSTDGKQVRVDLASDTFTELPSKPRSKVNAMLSMAEKGFGMLVELARFALTLQFILP